jgi:hypothetical protein
MPSFEPKTSERGRPARRKTLRVSAVQFKPARRKVSFPTPNPGPGSPIGRPVHGPGEPLQVGTLASWLLVDMGLLTLTRYRARTGAEGTRQKPAVSSSFAESCSGDANAEWNKHSPHSRVLSSWRQKVSRTQSSLILRKVHRFGDLPHREAWRVGSETHGLRGRNVIHLFGRQRLDPDHRRANRLDAGLLLPKDPTVGQRLAQLGNPRVRHPRTAKVQPEASRR